MSHRLGNKNKHVISHLPKLWIADGQDPLLVVKIKRALPHVLASIGIAENGLQQADNAFNLFFRDIWIFHGNNTFRSAKLQLLSGDVQPQRRKVFSLNKVLQCTGATVE